MPFVKIDNRVINSDCVTYIDLNDDRRNRATVYFLDGVSIALDPNAAAYLLDCVDTQDHFDASITAPQPMALTTRMAIYLRDDAPLGATLKHLYTALGAYGSEDDIRAAASSLFNEGVIVTLDDGTLLHKTHRARVMSADEIAAMDRAALSPADRATLEASEAKALDEAPVLQS